MARWAPLHEVIANGFEGFEMTPRPESEAAMCEHQPPPPAMMDDPETQLGAVGVP